MANALADSKGYFLGVGGSQSGPHTETEVIQKIRAGVVTGDTLLWYDGLPEWQPASSVPSLKAVFAEPVKPLGAPNFATLSSAPKTHSSSNEPDLRHESLAEGEVGEPVFATDEAVFETSTFVRNRPKWVLGGIVGAIALLYLLGTSALKWFSSVDLHTRTIPTKNVKEIGVREKDLRQSLSELNLNPKPSITTLTRLVQENSKDVVGKEALTNLVDYYRRNQAPAMAGQIYLLAKSPRHAAIMFLQDPNTLREAESAFNGAYEGSPTKGPEEKDDLLQDIGLLLGPLNDVETAKKRITSLERDFPNDNHPFKYYLKTPDAKLEDIFSRISFFFVNSLLNYLQSELPQIVLAKRPLIELVRENDGKFRIIGKYQGDVFLNQDKLPAIRFTFWLSRSEWHIVETNLTKDRAQYAKVTKTKFKNDAISAEQMLYDLEAIFKQQFPKNGLHELVIPPAEKTVGEPPAR
jgi:hypothetical protein